TRRPSEPERCRAHAHADRAVRTICTAVRISARNELSWKHEPLFREIEVEDAVTRRCVVRRLQALLVCECAADARLLLVILPAGEDEVVVGDRGLPGVHRTATGDLIE